MKDIDKLIRQAKRLEIQSRPYNRVSVVVCVGGGTWAVKGYDEKFRLTNAALQFCKDKAAGRDYSVIIDDIPRSRPEDMPEGYMVNHPGMLTTREVGLWQDSE